MKKDLHIGSLIKSVVVEKKIEVVAFADALCCDRSNIYSIFERKTIDTDKLIRISEILGHNFLLEYFEEEKPYGDCLILIETTKKEIDRFALDKSLKVIQIWSKV